MSTEQFSLCWDNFHKNMSSGMHSLLETEDLVDVTLAVEGRYLKAHKMVLSVCSPYFRELFKINPCQHPIVFMKDVSYQALTDLLQFMYQGEVQVLQENLGTFIKTAEALQIKGLTNDSANTDDVADSDKPPGAKTQKRPFDSDEFKVTTTKVKRTIGPASKKNKSEMSRPEVTSTPATEVVEFKMEPYESTDNGSVSRLNQEDSMSYIDENNDDGTDDHEDYSLIEGNVDDPQAGTSSETAGENQDEKFGELDIARLMPLPEKSIERYLKEYKVFCNWREENHIVGVNERAMLAFFEDHYKNSKPSCLWTYYAMIQRCLLIHENVDIKRYGKLRQYLKQKSVGFTSKKSKVLTHSEIIKFLNEANDDDYLLWKVILILGIFGACRCEELVNLTIDDVEDRGNFIKVCISQTTGTSRSFVITEEENGCHPCSTLKKYMALRPVGLTNRRFLIGYRNKKCTAQVVGVNTVGSAPRKIAKYLGLPDANKYTGHCFRRSSLLKHGGWHL